MTGTYRRFDVDGAGEDVSQSQSGQWGKPGSGKSSKRQDKGGQEGTCDERAATGERNCRGGGTFWLTEGRRRQGQGRQDPSVHVPSAAGTRDQGQARSLRCVVCAGPWAAPAQSSLASSVDRLLLPPRSALDLLRACVLLLLLPCRLCPSSIYF